MVLWNNVIVPLSLCLLAIIIIILILLGLSFIDNLIRYKLDEWKARRMQKKLDKALGKLNVALAKAEEKVGIKRKGKK